MKKSKDKENFWFPAKRYGWGWGLPCRWQGWVVLVMYLMLVLTAVFFLSCGTHPPRTWGWHCLDLGQFHRVERLSSDVGDALFVTTIALLTLGLIAVCWIKGEKPRWRWGKD